MKRIWCMFLNYDISFLWGNSIMYMPPGRIRFVWIARLPIVLHVNDGNLKNPRLCNHATCCFQDFVRIVNGRSIFEHICLDINN